MESGTFDAKEEQADRYAERLHHSRTRPQQCRLETARSRQQAKRCTHRQGAVQRSYRATGLGQPRLVSQRQDSEVVIS